MRNLNEAVVGYLNVNLIRNMFDSFARQTTRNIGIQISQNQSLMKVFLPVNFYCMTTVPLSILIGMEWGMVVVFSLHDYSTSFHFDRNGNGGGILLYIWENIPSTLLSMNETIQGFLRRNKFTK